MTDLRKSPLAPDIPSFHPRGGLAPGEKGVRTAILTPPGDRSSRTPSCSLKGEGSPQEDAPRDAPAGLGWGNQQRCRNQAGAQAAPWRRRSSPPPNSAVRKDQLAGARRPEHPGTDLERRPAGALFRPAAPLGRLRLRPARPASENQGFCSRPGAAAGTRQRVAGRGLL